MNTVNKLRYSSLLALAILLTGCPSNDYTVDLKPHGNTIERILTFYCSDGTNKMYGTTNFQSFPAKELAAITALYPAGSVTNEGQRHIARAEFANAMPDDIGGAGTYSNFSTSLGSAAIYTERFRGNDDVATPTEARLHAADQLVDYVIGWSRAELGSDPHYPDLRKFLDTDFRRDVKNASLYWWLGQIFDNDKPQGGEEYMARFGQYLVEHGYLKLGELPQLVEAGASGDMDGITRLVQRLVARKLGVPDFRPIPKSLAFLSDTDSMQASWEKYLATTPEYRRLLWHWRRQKMLATWLNPSYVAHRTGAIGGAATNAPPPPMPQPHEALDQISTNFLAFSFSTPDRVTVNLALPTPPLHTNGKWDEAGKQVTWQRGIEPAGEYSPLPAFFFATWATPDEGFQKAHFGKVLVNGDDLLTCVLWRNGLNSSEGRECDTLLAGLQPSDDPASKFIGFHFSDEPTPAGTNAPLRVPSDYLRDLFKTRDK